MRKTRLVLALGVAGLLAAGLVAFLWPEPGTEQPLAANVAAPEGLAAPPGGGNPAVSPQGAQHDNSFASLDQEEIARAQSMVANDPRVVVHTQGLRHAVLSVQRHREEKDNLQARRAEVFIYVYPSGRSLYALANLRTNTVDEVRVAPGLQKAITPTEASWALDIALADPEAGALIRENYQQVTGSPLLRADQLRVSIAGVYLGHLRPIPTASACGVERCVQLHLALANGSPIGGPTPIVNLTTERVVYPGQ